MDKRQFIGFAGSALPVILTLRPSSVLAFGSCTSVGPETGKINDGDRCAMPDMSDTCSGQSMNSGVLVDPISGIDSEGNTIYHCPSGAFVISNGAFTSLFDSSNLQL